MGKKTISNTFTVNTVDDPVGLVAQYCATATPSSSSQIHTSFQTGDLYMRTRTTEETFSGYVDPNHPWNKIVGESGGETDYQFALSSNLVTQDGTSATAPSDISSSAWQDAPMATTTQKPYLWAKVQKKSWNASTQSYDVDSTTYIRLTGEDGSSVLAQYAPNNNPSSSQIHDTWQSGDLYMRTKSTTDSNWSSWHKIVGESGDETDYNFNISKSKTSTNSTTAPSDCYYTNWQDAPVAPTSTYPYMWMKIIKKTWNESTQSYDSGTPSYARVTGELGIDYEIRCTLGSVQIPTDEDSASISATFSFFYKESGKTPLAYNAYYALYYRVGNTYTRISSGSSSSYSLSSYNATNSMTAFVCYIFSSSYSGTLPESQTYLAKLEVPIVNNGDNGLAPNPNILLRTVFDRGIDKVKEKWSGDWAYISVDTSTDTLCNGRKSIRINASGVDCKDFMQNVYSRVKTNTWYTLSFNVFSTADWYSFIWSGSDSYAAIDQSAGMYIDGVFQSSAPQDGSVLWSASWYGLRHSVTFKTKSSFSTTAVNILFRAPSGGQICICMPKLEEGKVATPYMANEDDLVGNDGQSITGPRGKIGRFFYYAGEFDSSNTTQTFVINDAQAPYFSHGVNATTGLMNCHVYNPTVNGTFTMAQMWANSSQSWNNAPWEVMTNDFKYLITQAMFTKFAQLGSGIFNEDWLFSAYGKREKVLKSSSSSINQGTNYNYIQVPNMTSIDVIEGNIYSFYITWYSVSGYRLMTRVAISTDGGSNYDTTEEFDGTNDSTSHVDVLSFRARFTGKATLFYCGSGTITKVVTYDDSTISGTNTGYRKFTPSFPNTDYVHINASNAGRGIDNTTYNYVSLLKFTVIEGMTYKLQMGGIIQSGSGTCYISVYKYSDNTPINLYGAENTEGVYYGTTTDGGYYRMFFDNPTRITKAASFTPNFSGEIVVMGRISSSGVVGDLQDMILIPVKPFVPKVAIDWLSGYAHFGGDNVRFNEDGSGHLAAGNITWDAEGSAEFDGTIKANGGSIDGTLVVGSTNNNRIIISSQGEKGAYLSGIQYLSGSGDEETFFLGYNNNSPSNVSTEYLVPELKLKAASQATYETKVTGFGVTVGKKTTVGGYQYSTHEKYAIDFRYNNTNNSYYEGYLSFTGGQSGCSLQLGSYFVNSNGDFTERPVALFTNTITGQGTKYLPSPPIKGMVVFAKGTTGSLIINGNGKQIMRMSDSGIYSNNQSSHGSESVIFVYDGIRWLEFYCG